MSLILEVQDLHAQYGKVEVLHGINLEIRSGEITALLGANGAGKTTTLRAISQMMVDTKGSIKLDGTVINDLPTAKIAHLGLGHVPDGRGTFLGLTTLENLRLGAHSRPSKKDLNKDIEQIYEYFPRLAERHSQQAGTLSGGEQQMLAIGRALMGKPKLLLLDEPSFGIAPLVVNDIFKILKRLNQDQGVSILIVEQNARLALDLADSAYLLETGRVVLHGPASEIKQNDAVRQAYLGV